MLENRQDLAIGAFSSRMNGLVYQPLYREQHWLYCSDRHPLFDGRRIPADLITQQRMVGRGYWSQAELARHGFKHSAGTVESMEAQLILILSGGYIGYLPEHYAHPWVEQAPARPAAGDLRLPGAILPDPPSRPLARAADPGLPRPVADADEPGLSPRDRR